MALWGKFESREEVQKFIILAITFFLVIGVYWAMRPIKDSMFMSLVGSKYIPIAKWVSLFVITPLVLVYSKLIDTFPRHKVFYMLIGGYTVLTLLFSFLLSMLLGMPAEELAVNPAYKVIAWAWYTYVESFGSLIVALFWGFTTDITSSDSAKRGFPIIALFGQAGNICGPQVNAARFGFANSGPVLMIVAVLTALIGVLIWIFMRVTPDKYLAGYEASKKEEPVEGGNGEPGFFEGLKMMVTKPYLLGIFLVIFFYEVIVTVIDFVFKTMVGNAFPVERDAGAYLSQYGSWTGIVSLTCVLLGINNIQRHLGLTASLILTPLLVATGVLLVKFSPMLGVVFWIMVCAKAINYALNQPTIKQLYIPTSKDAKYKTQAWIEMFGGRGAKASGSSINIFRAFLESKYGQLAGLTLFLTVSTGISMGLIGIWLFVVMFLAKTHNKAVREKRVVC